MTEKTTTNTVEDVTKTDAKRTREFLIEHLELMYALDEYPVCRNGQRVRVLREELTEDELRTIWTTFRELKDTALAELKSVRRPVVAFAVIQRTIADPYQCWLSPTPVIVEKDVDVLHKDPDWIDSKLVGVVPAPAGLFAVYGRGPDGRELFEGLARSGHCLGDWGADEAAE